MNRCARSVTRHLTCSSQRWSRKNTAWPQFNRSPVIFRVNPTLPSFVSKFFPHRGFATETMSQYRLPTNVKPSHYDVLIQTDLERLAFQGTVKISLDILEETNTIVMNSDDLELGIASIHSQALRVEQVQSKQDLDVPTKRLTVSFAKALPAGSKAEIKIPFKGVLGDSMTGYYRSSWSPEGKEKYYALTQFEATDARRAFPCWDEPALKATFSITMISRANTVNLSNSSVISEEPYKAESDGSFADSIQSDEPWKITRFQKTPRMSSYLVAYANGPFEYLETFVDMPLSGKKLPLRIYTTPDSIHQAQFALDVKAKVLPIYEEIFDVEYPLPKLDTLVASEFDEGAMENWGLITGRDTAFLLDPKKTDLSARKNVISTQSHEVAHMWFGNITTMAWWDYLYLNEGFATLMGELIIPNRAYPELKPNSAFINDHLAHALALDAKLSSHPIEVACPNADDINQIFDDLSYSKAGSVLRMLANFVGEERFLKGVSLYLKDKLFANSVTNDLWQGIGKATGLDIVNLMENWITKIGFPVLTVTENPNGIHVRQDRFLETGMAKPEDNTTIWNIPLFILATDADGKVVVDKETILTEREMTIPLDTSKTFKLNAGTSGVYRVIYTPERLAKIAAEAAKEVSCFNLDDRMGLVYDAFALAKAGLAPLSSALNLVKILKNETEYLVWSTIASNLAGLKSMWWEDKAIVDKLDAFRRSLFVPLVTKYGFDFSEDDDQETKEMRTLAISSASSAGHQETIDELKRRFHHFMKTGDDSIIPADLTRITYSTAIKHGTVEEYDAIVKIHRKSPTPTAGSAARIAIGQTLDHDLLKRTFEIMLTGSRDQDVHTLFTGVAGNTKYRRELAIFFRENYDAFYARFEKNSTLRYLVQYSVSQLSSLKDAEETKAFYKNKETSKFYLVLAQSIEGIETKASYINRSTEDMKKWLEEQ